MTEPIRLTDAEQAMGKRLHGYLRFSKRDVESIVAARVEALTTDLAAAERTIANIQALRDDVNATRLTMCRACRDPEFARTHGHDCGNTRKWFVEALDALLPAVPANQGKRVRPWRAGDGDTRCQECGHTYQPWFTDNHVWNRVMGGPDATDDPGGYLCPRCFTTRAETVLPSLAWHLAPADLGNNHTKDGD